MSLEVNRAIHQLYREIRGTLATTAALGRRWLRNSLINFIGIDEIFPSPALRRRAAPTVIGASGPSLAEGIDFLASRRELFELWALPSAVDFLLARGISPDTVVLTDPSYYAFSHLQSGVSRRLHLTMPLSAAAGSWRISARVSLLNQDTPVERALLSRCGAAAVNVPAQGTVAATALLLALAQRTGPVIFTGLDFKHRDIFSHVRPNNFETWLRMRTDRLSPLHHRLFALAADHAPAGRGGKRRSLALETYAGWFAEIGRTTERRIYRFHPSTVPVPGIREIGESELNRLLEPGGTQVPGNLPDRGFPPIGSYPRRGRRLKIVAAVLSDWIDRIERLIPAVSGSSTLDPLLQDEESLSLLYLCNAAQLSEARRTLRLQGSKRGVDKIRTLLEKHRQFLDGLHREMTEGR
jgi:hypothetical protein